MPEHTEREHVEPTTTDQAGSGSSRRTLLRAAGMVALAGGGAAALAACSSGQEATPATPSGSSAAESPSSSTSASGSASSSASGSAASGPSVAAAEVPVGGGVILEDAKYVVTQPAKGEFKAFSSICTHAGCPVSEVVDQQIVCKCHNSHFSITDGSVKSGPAKKPLPEAKATLSGSNVVVTG